MKVPIVITRLTDSPYSAESKDSFLLEDEDSVNQLVLELKNARPSSFLISGYRGVGKTSFVNRVREKLTEDTVLINISLAKYDGYKVLVKQIIRQLYLSFQEQDCLNPLKVWTDQKREGLSQLNSKLTLLYDRTFYDISTADKRQVVSEEKRTKEFNFDIKKIAPVVVLFITGTNAIFKLSDSTFSNYMFFLISIIWASISAWNIKFQKTNTESSSEELSRKTLYDDEIAEHHLFQVLKELKHYKIKVLIVFDELDKINAADAIDGIINDLKPLLLCGYANFFVVAGQGLYYQLEKSKSTDDPVITSLFSKTIHVPFLSYSSLKKFCLNLVDNDDEVKKLALFNDYFDSLILEAGSVPRKLSNLVRDKLIWEENKAYIMINEAQQASCKFESRLLSIATKIMDGDLPKYTSNVVKRDFFIAQIHLWIFRVKSYKSNRFTIDEIITLKSYKPNDYPETYTSQLNALCELLFDRLIEAQLLEKEENPSYAKTYYSWVKVEVNGADNNSEEGDGTTLNPPTDDTEPDFLREFGDLVHFVNGICNDILDKNEKTENDSLKGMITRLIDKGVLPKNWAASIKIDALNFTRNKVAQGMSVEAVDLNIIQNSRFDIGRIKAELIEDYTYYVTKRHLENYKVTKENKGGFDFIAKGDKCSIAFEVKYLQYGRPDNRNVIEIVNKFTNYLQSFDANTNYVLFFYQPNGRKSYDEFYAKFFDMLNSKMPDLKERFHLFYTSEDRGDANSGRIEEYLDQVLSKISEQEIIKYETVQDVFPGTWLNTWQLPDGRSGEEVVEVKKRAEYYANGNHVFNLDSFSIDNEKGLIIFRKVGIGGDKRSEMNILHVINKNKYEGTESGVTKITYTKIG